MDLLRLGLGVISIIGGVSALRKGVGHLSQGMGRVQPGGGVPTKVIKRQRGRKLRTTVQGRRVPTAAGPMRVTLKSVATLDDRLAQIIELAEAGKTDPEVIAWTRRELSKKCRPGWNGEQWCVPEKDTKAEIEAIFKAMRRDVRYTSDVHGVDTYAHPRMALRTRGEDCDGFSSLGCAALMSVGIPCRFEVIQTRRSSTPDHIYIQGGFPKENPTQWYSLDASVPMPPGWRAPDSMVARRWIYEV
jgi:Transglutaminase-like superfamily